MYNKNFTGDVCSASHSFLLDNFFRRWFQNPEKVVGEYICNGNTVIDLGCGPGYFSIDMAKMVGSKGQVIAVDLQKEMLEKVKKKALKFKLDDRMIFHNCSQNNIGLGDEIKADFILAFYMVHETPDPIQFLTQAKNLLKKGGTLLIVEPLFHVTKKQFQKIIQHTRELDFNILDTPSKKGGRSLLLSA